MATKKRKSSKKRASNLPARRSTPKAHAPKRRRRRSGGLSSNLSGGSFMVLGKAFAEAAVGAVIVSVANSAVKNQSAAVRIAVNIAVPMGISKMAGKPMMAAGAAGIGGINVIKVLVPNSKFLSDFDPDSFMNDLSDSGNGALQAHNYASVQKINASRWIR